MNLRLLFKEKINNKLEVLLFYSTLIIILTPIWLNQYFLTGDGPSHLYNSKVLLDIFLSNDVGFYKEYYDLNLGLTPNWFTHVFLAFLIQLLPVLLVEKIFISIYVISFALTLRLLVAAIKPENVFLSILSLPFIFHLTFQTGFFNYSFSIVFFLFTIWFWIRHANYFTFSKILILSLVGILSFFTHPIGYLLTVLAVGVIITIDFIRSKHFKETTKFPYGKLLHSIKNFTLSFIPSLILLFNYIFNTGTDIIANTNSKKWLYHSFIELKSLIIITYDEKPFAITIAILFGLLFIYTIYNRIKDRKLELADSFLVLFLITILIYFFQPGGMAGGLLIRERLQFIPYLMLILWFVGSPFNKVVKKIIPISLFIIVACLTYIRLPIYSNLSDAVEEYISVGKFIPDKSTVLPLSFSHNGKMKLNGDLISNRVWLFMHAADYLGLSKPLILLGNYEANTNHFPLKWKVDKNPFIHIGKNEGIENQPPSVNIINYNLKTKSNVDYIILWCLDKQYQNHPYSQDILKQLSDNYKLIYTSQNKRALLYERVSLLNQIIANNS